MPWGTRHRATSVIGLLCAIVAGLAWCVRPADAALMQVFSRADLGATARIDWSALGSLASECPCIGSIPGVTFAVDSPTGLLEHRTEGVNWIGNFAPGDALLLSPVDTGPAVDFQLGSPMMFSNPVSAAGAQIQPAGSTTVGEPLNTVPIYGPFTAQITVILNDGPAQRFRISGNSTAAEDNSAPFLGVVSTANDIIGLGFAIIPSNPQGPLSLPAAINALDVRAPVSEPSSGLVLGVAMMTLIISLVSSRCRN